MYVPKEEYKKLKLMSIKNPYIFNESIGWMIMKESFDSKRTIEEVIETDFKEFLDFVRERDQ